MTALFFAFDVETTGLDAGEDVIISIAYRLLAPDLTVLSGDLLYASPGERAVHPKAAAVNGYTPEKWASYNALTQKELAACMSNVLSAHKGLIPLGHNVKFDLGFLQALCMRHDAFDTFRRGLSYHSVDTVAAAIFFDYVVWEKLHGSYSLVNLVERFALVQAKAHTADSDIDATIELFKTLRNGLRPSNPEVLLALTATAAPEKRSKFFSKNAADQWQINTGKHKGKLLDDVYAEAPDYLVWMLDKFDDLARDQHLYLSQKVAAYQLSQGKDTDA
jgi:DNA polymerase III alpha subunit (gram-positive type)